MNIFLIRHAETQFNKQNIVQGYNIDAPLTQEGIESVVKYVNADDVVDHSKLRPGEAVGLLRAYKTQGAITHEMVEGQMYAKKKHNRPTP